MALPARLPTKADFYGLYKAGLLGNHLRMWSLEEYHRGYRAAKSWALRPVAVRLGIPGSPNLRFDMSPSAALAYARKLISGGVPEPAVVLCEQAPDADVTLQGVAQRLPGGLCLHYAVDCTGMRWRESLAARGRHVSGLSAQHTLQAYLDPASYDWVMALLDHFDGAAVEFGTYRRRVGSLGLNTVIWEVRHY
jgi:hypothetical protein